MNSTQVDELFLEAMAEPTAETRAAFLDRACHGNAELREKVDALLSAHEAAGSFLELPESDEATVPITPLSERPGTIIGPYKLLQQIGEGGMGVVFMAEQTEPIQRTVALKIIKPGMDSRHVIARFEAERQALALMDHPNIARVLDAGTTGSGRPYFVMELVKGVPITQYCDDHQVTPRRRLEVFSSVCQAVQHAHQKGIIHRDLKPSNVMVALYDGRPVPKIIDFGVAKATGSKLTERTLFTEFGAILGTLEYMSPEQAELNQLDVDTRSDIYSLGVLLYELLTGSTPLERKRIKAIALHEVLRVIREEEPPKPSTRLSSSDALPSIAANRGFEPLKLNRLLQGELDWIVMKALEKDRNRRYDTANSFAADVQRYLADEQVQACPPSAGYRLRKFARRNKVAISTTAVVGAALALGIIVSTRQAIRASKAEAQSESRRITVVNYLQLRASGEYRNARISEGVALLSRVYEEAGPDTALCDSVRRVMLGWSGQSGRPIVQDTAILSAAFSPDGRTILLGGHDRKCTVYNAQTTVPIGRPLEHAKSVRAVAFSPDGRIVLTGSEDETAQLWDCEAGIPIGKPLRHEGVIWAVAYSPDGKTVVTAGQDHGARLWNAATGVSLGPPLNHPQNVLSVSFSPNGQKLLTGCMDGTGRIWDVRTKALTQDAIRIGSPIYAVAFSPDGRKILTGSANGSAQLWDAQSLKPVGNALQHYQAVYAVAWSPDGREILTGSFDKTARLWNAETHKPIGEPLRHDNWVMAVAFSPDGRTVLTGGADHVARLWDVRTSDASIINENAKARAFLPDPKIVFTGIALRTMQLANPQAAAILSAPLAWCPSLNILANSRDGHTLLVRQSEVDAQIWDLKKEKPHGELIHHDSKIWAAAFSADGRTLLTGGQDQIVRLWNVESGEPIRPPIRHGGIVNGIVKSVAFSQSGKWILSGSSDATARIWDARTGSPKGEPMQNPGEVKKVAFSPDDHLALTVCSDGSARLWEFGSCELLARLLQYEIGTDSAEMKINDGIFSSDGLEILFQCSDGTVRPYSVPQQLPDNSKLVRAWSKARTGYSLDDRGVPRQLSRPEWLASQEELNSLEKLPSP